MDDRKSKQQTLKSLSILGGAQILVIFLGIVRIKLLAILLGPLGIGIAGLYQSTIDFIRSATGLGLGFSSIRDIAKARNNGTNEDVSKIALVLKYWTWGTGILGVVLVIFVSKYLSIYTFGNSDYTSEFVVLSVILLFTSISSGKLALLQGFQKVKELAKANIIGSSIGLIVSIPIYLYLREKGIIPVLILIAFANFLTAWYYSSNLKFFHVKVDFKQIFYKGLGMVKLGAFTVVSSFIDIGTLYFVRVYIAKNAGFEQAGQFISAWTVSTLYLSAILNSMGPDYYPKLVSNYENKENLNKTINNQIELLLNIASPIIILFISFIEIIVPVFYSNEFTLASKILNWQLVGDFFKLITWSLSFVLLAKGFGRAYLFFNIFWCLLYFGFIYIGWNILGVEVTGVSFTIAHLLTLIVYTVYSRYYFNFRWVYSTKYDLILYLLLILVSFFVSIYIETNFKYVFGSILSIFALFCSYKKIDSIFDFRVKIKRLLGN